MATKSNNEIQSSKPQKHLALEGQLPLRDELKVECEVMIKYAMASGFSLPPAAVQALQILSDCTQPDQDQCGDLKQLALAHEQLTQIVAPATPRTLLYSGHWNQISLWQFLGQARMVAGIIGLALAFLILFIGLSRYAPNSEFLLLAAAGMGASFSALFEASNYIVNSTFDPRYRGYYYVKIVLGLTSGFILAHLKQAGSGATRLADNLLPATLALVGGFSGTVVYNILKRLSDGVESTFQGDSKSAVAAQQSAARSHAAAEIDRAKVKQAAALVDLQNFLGAGNASPAEVREKINQMMNDLGVASSTTITTVTRPPLGQDSTSGDRAQVQAIAQAKADQLGTAPAD